LAFLAQLKDLYILLDMQAIFYLLKTINICKRVVLLIKLNSKTSANPLIYSKNIFPTTKIHSNAFEIAKGAKKSQKMVQKSVMHHKETIYGTIQQYSLPSPALPSELQYCLMSNDRMILQTLT
jgi:hypothetical protein